VRALCKAFVPGYAQSYVALGDPESYSLKYSWELAVYFGFYVFPFINDFFTEPRSCRFLKRFSRLGASITRCSDDRRLLPRRGAPASRSRKGVFDFMTFPALAAAGTTFYKVGVTVEESRRVLDEQLVHLGSLRALDRRLDRLARHRQPGALTDRAFVESLTSRL
jgi:hypothetical protein